MRFVVSKSGHDHPSLSIHVGANNIINIHSYFADFDEDGFIGTDDIIKVIKGLLGENCATMLNELKEKQRKGTQSTPVENESQQQLHGLLKQVANSVSRYIGPLFIFISRNLGNSRHQSLDFSLQYVTVKLFVSIV